MPASASTHQLEPLRKALRLPRVNLFIADDVGLGKTIEGGLIARELLLRKRIDTIVVTCPPAILLQWQEELEARIGLGFVILDRAFIAAMRRERGFSVNPWRTHSRFLISHRLLIDEAYAAGLRDWLGDFRPRSMLIIDEAHHAAPASGARYAIDSQITRTMRDVAPRNHRTLGSPPAAWSRTERPRSGGGCVASWHIKWSRLVTPQLPNDTAFAWGTSLIC